MSIKTNHAKYISTGAYDAIIGDSAQVSTGKATHTSLQAANDSFAAFGNYKILILPEATAGGLNTSSRHLTVEGKTQGCQITGAVVLNNYDCTFMNITFASTVTINASCDRNFFLNTWFSGGNVTVASGSVGNRFIGYWINSGSYSITDNNADTTVNTYLGNDS